jgi:U32 family peptidase
VANKEQRLPELLAPAGDWECVKAAVENGADAIYFGLDRFNARMRAKNFTAADLPQLMSFLHRRGVRGYVTFNTLIFSNELEDAADFLKSIIAAGVDAAIVQDVGVCRLIRELSPDFPIHASTQMTVSSGAGVEFARDLGCELVVLARECSIEEIGKIDSPIPLEVFVHGALCVAYSGQCLTSESLGGRSANRGECAQACRMPYDLISDGQQVDLDGRQYLLSPQDLAGLEVVPELVKAGVRSLKIEGRLKAPEYVASITRVYRRALDDCLDPAGMKERREDARYDLEMAFSRGLYTGWFKGIDNQELVHARFGKKRGVLLGRVRQVDRDSVTVDLKSELKAGDGIVFDHGNPGDGEEGGRVFELLSGNRLTFMKGAVRFDRVKAGDRVWKTDDPELNKRVRQTFEGEKVRYQRPVDLEIHGAVGLPMTVLARDEQGNVARAVSAMELEVAEKRPLGDERLREQFGRLGGTAFRLGELKNRLEGEVMLPVSELNRVRREAVAQLDDLRTKPKRWELNAGAQVLTAGKPYDPAGQAAPELIVQIRELGQLEPVLEAGVRTIYCDFEFLKKYQDAVEWFRERKLAGAEIFVAPPRIYKPGEEWILKQVRACGADGYLVRNHEHLKYFSDDRRRGDFSLNVANHLTAGHFKNQFGLEYLTASYDLNNVQLEALLKVAPPEWFEVTIHQHMPMFHMEHCVFCAFMSDGKDYRDCGRPCEKHDVKLRDRVGLEHPLKADAGCRNTVYNARAQTGAESVARMRELGVSRFRIEFVNESREEISKTIESYRALLDGRMSGSDLWRELKLQNQLGVTRGQQFSVD